MKRIVTPEELENNSYPLCSRCENYYNICSTIFGDAWSCTKGGNSGMVDDNRWEIENMNSNIIFDCGLYKHGTPSVNVLG